MIIIRNELVVLALTLFKRFYIYIFNLSSHLITGVSLI